MRPIASRAVLSLVVVLLAAPVRPLAAQLTQVNTTEGVVRGTLEDGVEFDVRSVAEPERWRERYEALDRAILRKR